MAETSDVIAKPDLTKRVYKYPLQLASGPQVVTMPYGARLVHVHEQNDRPTIWAEVRQGIVNKAPEDWVFWVLATGEDIPERCRMYVGTVHVGWTVWHIYEGR